MKTVKVKFWLGFSAAPVGQREVYCDAVFHFENKNITDEEIEKSISEAYEEWVEEQKAKQVYSGWDYTV